MISPSTDTETALKELLTDEQVAELMADDMLPEYTIGYSKTRPNRFTGRVAAEKTIKLNADVPAVFQAAEAVNTALRALIQATP